MVMSSHFSGHLTSLLPIIRAFRDAGDEVVVATGAGLAPVVEKVGAKFYEAAHGASSWFYRLRERTRGNPGDGIVQDRLPHYWLPRLFGEIGAADMIDGVLAGGREMAPDLVLFENCAFAGPLAVEVLGVPGANHLFGQVQDHEPLVLVNDAVSPLWRSFGRDVPGYAGVYSDVTIKICLPSLEAFEVPAGQTLSLRPAPLREPAKATPSHPLVYVTFGTVLNTNLGPKRTVLEGLAGEPIDVVLTVGNDQDPAALAPFPRNSRVERFIPQASLLPTCSAVIHHGGAGTTFGALAHGIPQVIIPQGEPITMRMPPCANAQERLWCYVATISHPWALPRCCVKFSRSQVTEWQPSVQRLGSPPCQAPTMWSMPCDPTCGPDPQQLDPSGDLRSLLHLYPQNAKI